MGYKTSYDKMEPLCQDLGSKCEKFKMLNSYVVFLKVILRLTCRMDWSGKQNQSQRDVVRGHCRFSESFGQEWKQKTQGRDLGQILQDLRTKAKEVGWM